LILDVKEVWLDPKERIRQDYGDVKRMLVSLHKYGQLQAIRVRPPNEDEDTDGQKWVVVDGGRRMLAIELARQNRIEIRKQDEPGQINVEVEDQVDDLFALELEYFANEDRKDFDWKERANFIRRIHEGHLAKDKDWLDFFQHPEAFQDESVQSALTFNVAYKQFQIAKEHAKRERVVAHREKRLAARKGSKSDSPVQTEEDVPQAEGESPVSAYLPPSEFAQHICNLGDCREWIEQIPDDTFEWAHWDPPYGGEQSGGAFARFDAIDDTWVYARMLMRDMLPHIWRVLKHGSWLALWYHPQYYHDIVMMLLGHEYDWEEGRCQHCDTEWETHKLILKTCKGNKKWRFWVNPYPNIWFKVDRTSSGQEIRRFLVNAYETFLFASVDKKEHGQPSSVLPKTDRQNVFTIKQVERGTRRHQMHKPAELLAKILECISIQGEFGFDPSYGSGSIFEAALGTNRKVVGCELEKKNRNQTIEVVEELVKEMGLEPYPLDFSQ
jgi:DNA modification methylase